MFFGFTAPNGDIFAWTAGNRATGHQTTTANNYIGKLAGMFSHLHLRTVEAAQDGVEDIAWRKVVEIAVDEAPEAICLLPRRASRSRSSSRRARK